MSFPRYPAYKDSGVEWLGEVPGHWYAGRFSRAIKAIKDGTHGTFERVSAGRPLLSAKNVQDGYVHVADDESMVSESDHLSIIANGFPQKGDLLLTIVGTIGRSCVYKFDDSLAFQRSVCFIRLLLGNETKFFYYFTQSKFFQEQLVSRSKSAAQGGVYMGDVVATSIVYPPLPEQTQIAAFLDREIAKIDGLVAEQRRLMALLKEKRQAVISHAVTQGLNPHAPMKPSGVEWLGAVPAHWAVTPLKHIADVQTGVAKGKDHGSRNTISVPYLRVANVQDGYLDLETVATMDIPPEDLQRYALQPGDVLMNEGGDFDKLGRGHVWNGQIEPCITQNHVFAVRPRKVASAWLNAITGSDFAQFYFMTRSKQSTNLASISSTNLMELPVILPPESEQKEILAFVTDQTARFDTLTTEAQRAIDLLQERRTALISAAVTGQIDVRGLAAVATY